MTTSESDTLRVPAVSAFSSRVIVAGVFELGSNPSAALKASSTVLYSVVSLSKVTEASPLIVIVYSSVVAEEVTTVAPP